MKKAGERVINFFPSPPPDLPVKIILLTAFSAWEGLLIVSRQCIACTFLLVQSSTIEPKRFGPFSVSVTNLELFCQFKCMVQPTRLNQPRIQAQEVTSLLLFFTDAGTHARRPHMASLNFLYV